ncbi:MAG: sigma-54 interaction domain-containing protein [Desulfovibrionales bacterium]
MIPSSLQDQRDVILDSITEGVFTVDKEWRITSFNRAAERITGVDRAEALGQACCDVFHSTVCENSCALRRTFETGKPIVNATAHIVDVAGRKVPIRISTAILRNEEGDCIGGVEIFQDLSLVEQLQKELESRYTFEDIVGRSPAMTSLFEILPQIAESSSTVLIQGPSGTGKELFARAIHNLSPRSAGRFVAVNCAALPDTLLESELFGHKAGAFTDAKRNKAGRFTLAHGGTIFLDEIGDISPALQVKLLRVLQERVIDPLGSIEPLPVDVRVVAATNQDLFSLVQEGRFREDLYYRIRVVHLQLPRLKERREDIPLLIDHILARLNRTQAKEIVGLSREAMARLMNHAFPGNVRELENILEQALVLCRGSLIDVHHLPPELRPQPSSGAGPLTPLSLAGLERQHIAEILRHCGGNRKQAAQILGIDPSTLYRKIRQLEIQVPEQDGRSRRE